MLYMRIVKCMLIMLYASMFIYACFSCLRYRLHVIFDPITNSQCIWSKMALVAKNKCSRHKDVDILETRFYKM